jgi:hypothetical protein
MSIGADVEQLATELKSLVAWRATPIGSRQYPVSIAGR